MKKGFQLYHLDLMDKSPISIVYYAQRKYSIEDFKQIIKTPDQTNIIASMEYHLPTYDKILYLNSLWVHPKFRRQGIGTNLLQHLLTIAKNAKQTRHAKHAKHSRNTKHTKHTQQAYQAKALIEEYHNPTHIKLDDMTDKYKTNDNIYVKFGFTYLSDEEPSMIYEL